MLQQDFHRGNNPAYDRVAFVAEHYEELVFMYKDILEHLKQGGTGTGGGCTHISKQVESPYGFVQLDKESFKLMGYDLNNPDDVQFLLHNTFVGSDKDGYYGYASSNGIEYHDTYEVNVGKLDTILVRDPDLDNFLDNLLSNPSMLVYNFWKISIYFDGSSRSTDITHTEIQSYANKEMFLISLYKAMPYWCMHDIQNNPIKLDIFNESMEKVYTKTSDSVENNPIYIGKTSEKIVTYNNVLLFPVEVSPSYALYPKTYSFKIKYMTKPYLRESVSILGWGDIITCKKLTNYSLPYLSADTPDLEYSPTDMHTFTYIIDPDIKDDC